MIIYLLCCKGKDFCLDGVKILKNHNKPSVMRLHEVETPSKHAKTS